MSAGLGEGAECGRWSSGEGSYGVGGVVFAAAGVSLREITAPAGANVAAANYHFGSKDDVLAELFEERTRVIVDSRLELLAQVRHHDNGAPFLEDVLRAFLRPSLDTAASAGGEAFMRLRARLALEAAEVRRDVLANAFDASSRQFLEALHAALPDLSTTELQWRFHFILGAMNYTMARPGRIESITNGALQTADTDAALEQLVQFATAGLHAP
ncbi:MAG: hypothetical protein JWM34_4825 [Ilumatobacteraceae bacterium]|nr:hypothetical protein [Ilumatobacteraceae bacterium]